MAIRPPRTPVIERSPYHGRRMSEAEYRALPEEQPYLEYIDGSVVQKAMANANHGRTVARVDFEFGLYVQRNGGDYGPERRVYLAALGHYRVPDTAYWAEGQPSGDDSVPALVVEVRSPGELMDAQRAKCRAFRQNGVDVCWLIDPETRTVEVFEGDRDGVPLASGGALTSVHLPDFVLPLAELWAVLDR